MSPDDFKALSKIQKAKMYDAGNAYLASLAEPILAELEKMDGKQITKRFEARLKKIDERLYFKYCDFNYGDAKDFYIMYSVPAWYEDYEPVTGCIFFYSENERSSRYVFKISQSPIFDFSSFQDKAVKKSYIYSHGAEFGSDFIEHAESLFAAYNEALKNLEDAKRAIPYYGFRLFGINGGVETSWRDFVAYIDADFTC